MKELIMENYKPHYLICKDCKEYLFRRVGLAIESDMFMVNDEIWDKYGNEEDILCPPCFESRMGRKLKKNDILDYADVPVNLENPYIQSL
tara:strand:- start:94 stop:363 length:270 start_codon:yes stop_codon:yes gene_type:complete